MPPINNDEPLVRSYLHHFFVDEANTKTYEPYISDVYLRENLAETKIVNGLGEPEQWYSLLPPNKYQALKDRIDLDFAHANQSWPISARRGSRCTTRWPGFMGCIRRSAATRSSLAV